MDKITLKLKELLKINNTLEQILNDNANPKIDSLFRFKILSILKNLEDYVINFHLIRNQKIQQYGHDDKEGNIFIRPDDKESIEKFNKDMLPILESNVELELHLLEQEDVFLKDLDSRVLVAMYPLIRGK